VAACLLVVLLVLNGAAFYLQDSTHCLHYGVLKPAELVADLSGEHTRTSKMDSMQSALAVLDPSKDQPASSTSFRPATARPRSPRASSNALNRCAAVRPMHLVRSPGDEYSSGLADEFQDVLKPERLDYDEPASTVTTQLGLHRPGGVRW
jgi:hypothetical protein